MTDTAENSPIFNIEETLSTVDARMALNLMTQLDLVKGELTPEDILTITDMALQCTDERKKENAST